jgi:Rne/Rng family ribonuclease
MRALAEQVMGDASDAVETLLEGDAPHALAWREWTEAAEVVTAPGCLAEHGALEAIAAARGAQVALPGGGHLYVEATRALVAVDVNTGSDTSLAAGLKANLAAARLLPRALRVRGLGGQIVIDMAPMPRKERRQVDQALTAAFRRDSTETTVLGWTPLGHVELQRKRDRLPLAQLLSDADG